MKRALITGGAGFLGSQSRSLCYADAIIEGFVRMMESKRGIAGPLNMGNPVEFTMLDLAEKVLLLAGAIRSSASSPCRAMPLGSNGPTSVWPEKSWAECRRCRSKIGLERPLLTSGSC